MKMQNQNGFAPVEGLLILIIVILIGSVGWLVWDRQHKTSKASTTNTATTSTAPAATTAEKINNYAECAKASDSKVVHEAAGVDPDIATCTTKSGHTFDKLDPSNYTKTGDVIDAPDSTLACDPPMPATRKATATLRYSDGTWARVNWQPRCNEGLVYIYKNSDTGWKIITAAHIFRCDVLDSKGIPASVASRTDCFPA